MKILAPDDTIHPWHALMRKREKTDVDRALLCAIMTLSTDRQPRAWGKFSGLTMEEIYDKLLEDWNWLALQ